MADGLFYNDIREPFVTVPPGAVTLTAADKALYTASQFPVLGGQYFARPGKKVKIRLFGQITTAATPGNGTFDVYYGTGADANGVLLAASAAHVLIASQTNQSWALEVVVTCRTTGSVGTLFCTGTCDFTPAVSAAGGGLIPASAPVVSAACDLTAALIISVQFKRSGSTVETIQVLEMEVTALN